MKHIVFSTGYECEIDEATFNDWEFAELVAQIDGMEEEGSNPLKSVRLTKAVFEMVLGVKGYKELKDSARDDAGRVPPETMPRLLEELFEKAGDEVKN